MNKDKPNQRAERLQGRRHDLSCAYERLWAPTNIEKSDGDCHSITAPLKLQYGSESPFATLEMLTEFERDVTDRFSRIRLAAEDAVKSLDR